MSGDRKQLAAVVIADERHASRRVGDVAQGGRHAVGDAGERGFAPASSWVSAGRGEREQVEVERVAVVVRRALGVKAVGEHLPIDLAHQDVAADPRPLRRRRASSGHVRPQT